MTTIQKSLATLVAGALLACAPSAARAETPLLQVNQWTGETAAQFAKRTQWWRDAKFGMFIHWGIYDVPNGDPRNTDPDKLGEWYLFYNRMQVADYEKYAPQFNPEQFNAHAWVSLAKAAGMKYMVFTAKHHDGFCLFDTKLTDYNIVKASPWHRDPLKELAGECRKQGLKLCVYYSYMDWHHPDYLPRREWDTRPTTGASLDRYTEYAKGQLRELLTNYGPIAGVWFDGGWEHQAAEEHSLEVVKMIRKLQPGIMINDRLNPQEDYSTPEQSIPSNAFPRGRLWETCMTTVTAHNLHWSYAWLDKDFKPSSDLIRKTCDIASKGGNFLLDIGPDARGVIRPEDTTHLREVGAWMKVNGESIYGTTQSPFKRLPFDGRVTRKGNSLYLQVFEWPQTGLSLVGLKTPVKEAIAVAGRERLATKTLPDGTVTIGKPAHLDPNVTVIEVRLKGAPVVDQTALPLQPQGDGAYNLSAADCTLDGTSHQVEETGGVPNIGYWTNPKDVVTWTIAVPKPGEYAVSLEYAAPSSSASATYTVSTDAPGNPSELTSTVETTGAYNVFKTVSMSGKITLTSGKTTVRVAPAAMPQSTFMNLRRVILTPIATSASNK